MPAGSAVPSSPQNTVTSTRSVMRPSTRMPSTYSTGNGRRLGARSSDVLVVARNRYPTGSKSSGPSERKNADALAGEAHLRSRRELLPDAAERLAGRT